VCVKAPNPKSWTIQSREILDESSLLKFRRAVQCIGKTRAHASNSDVLQKLRLMRQPQGCARAPRGLVPALIHKSSPRACKGLQAD
jgi:hypothetical protein